MAPRARAGEREEFVNPDPAPAGRGRGRRRRATHARDFLSHGRAASQALRRNLAARHDRACPGGRSPTTARVVPHPRVKGTRLLGAGDVREKGEEKRGHGGTRAPCGGGATFAVRSLGVGCCLVRLKVC